MASRKERERAEKAEERAVTAVPPHAQGSRAAGRLSQPAFNTRNCSSGTASPGNSGGARIADSAHPGRQEVQRDWSRKEDFESRSREAAEERLRQRKEYGEFLKKQVELKKLAQEMEKEREAQEERRRLEVVRQMEVLFKLSALAVASLRQPRLQQAVELDSLEKRRVRRNVRSLR